jgi:hypothetical protein
MNEQIIELMDEGMKRHGTDIFMASFATATVRRAIHAEKVSLTKSKSVLVKTFTTNFPFPKHI